MSYDHDGVGVSPETFQKIITERQAGRRQNAELKRIHDLKIIEDGMSKTGTLHPLDIFPQEIWEVIFSKLPPEDRANLWEVHQVFSTFISRVQDIIFPLIFKEKLKLFWNNPASEERSSDNAAPLGHCFELRRLSKGMRNAVDRFLEEDLLNCLRHPESHKKPRKTTNIPPKNIDFATLNSHQRIPSKSLRVEINGDPATSHPEQSEHFKRKLLSFLKLFGKKIWHFQFTFFHLEKLECGGLSQVYFLFVECLSLMPNLKWLQVNLDCNLRHSDARDCIDALFHHPPPMLQDLERMDFGEDEAWIAKFLYRRVLGANPHTKYLTMIRAQELHVHETLHHLESMIVLESNTDLLDFHGMTKNMLHVNMPLQRLRLFANLDGDSIVAVFKFLHKFPALEQVSLTLNEVTIGGGIDFLKLPNLKELDLQFNAKIVECAPIHFFFSLQFLLYCDKLKKLKWHDESEDCFDAERHIQDSKEYGGSVNMIDFQGGLGDLGDKRNNIWKVFPQLEYVAVCVLGKGDDGSWCRFLKMYPRGELR